MSCMWWDWLSHGTGELTVKVKVFIPRNGWVDYEVISYKGNHCINDFMMTSLEELDRYGLVWEYLK